MGLQRGSPEISCVDFRWSAEREVLEVLEVLDDDVLEVDDVEVGGAAP